MKRIIIQEIIVFSMCGLFVLYLLADSKYKGSSFWQMWFIWTPTAYIVGGLLGLEMQRMIGKEPGDKK